MSGPVLAAYGDAVTSSSTVPLPDPSLGLTWRAIREDDVPAWLELERAIEAADDPSEHYSADDLRDELLDGSWKEPERDSLLGLDGHGVARAFGHVDVRPGDTRSVRAFCWGGVHPEWRGRAIGRSVLAWQEARGRQKVAELRKPVRGRLLVHLDDGRADVERLLTRAGFRAVRWYLDMTRSLDAAAAPIPDLVLDQRLALVPYDRGLDEEVRLAHNEAFAEHWGSEPRSAEDWRRATTGDRHFRPDWSFVVLDGHEVAGYTLASAYESNWQAQGYRTGWTNLLGVRPAWRGRRLAPVLLAASMRAFKDAGMERAGIGVDSENGSGAVGLYTGLGYVTRRGQAAWAKDV